MGKHTKFFGLNMENVHRFYDKLDTEHAETTRHLQRQVDLLTSENQKLTEVIERIKEETKENVETDVFDYAKQTLPSLLKTIHQHVEFDMQETQEMAQSQMNGIQANIQKVEKEIHNGKLLLQRLINQVTKGIEDLSSLQSIDQTLSEWRESSHQNESKRSTLQEGKSSEPLIKSDDAIEPKPTFVTEKNDTNGGGQTVSTSPPDPVHQTISDSDAMQNVDELSAYLLQNWEGLSTEEQLETNVSSFWEGSEQVLTQALKTPFSSPIFDKSNKDDHSVAVKNESTVAFNPTPSQVSSQSTEKRDMGINSQVNTDKAEETLNLEPFQPETSSTTQRKKEMVKSGTNSEDQQPSEGIRQEIEFIKRRYISGKLAGSTLKDANGRLIIEKGAQITDEVVDYAHQEGLLSDLIVNMRIPGLGE